MPLTLRLHADELAVCRLGPAEGVPPWLPGAGFTSVTRTRDELSLVCVAAVIPAGVKHERDWRLLELVGPFPFEAVGILLSVLHPLAAAGISSLAVATHDTDYVLVKSARLAAARAALERAGHRII